MSPWLMPFIVSASVGARIVPAQLGRVRAPAPSKFQITLSSPVKPLRLVATEPTDPMTLMMTVCAPLSEKLKFWITVGRLLPWTL